MQRADRPGVRTFVRTVNEDDPVVIEATLKLQRATSTANNQTNG